MVRDLGLRFIMIEYKFVKNDLPNENYAVKVSEFPDIILINLPDFGIQINTKDKTFDLFEYEA